MNIFGVNNLLHILILMTNVMFFAGKWASLLLTLDCINIVFWITFMLTPELIIWLFLFTVYDDM